jgi:hypothetical protein
MAAVRTPPPGAVPAPLASSSSRAPPAGPGRAAVGVAIALFDPEAQKPRIAAAVEAATGRGLTPGPGADRLKLPCSRR